MIDPAKSYQWDTFVKVESLGAEFGFYIDEYNAAGDWISGFWKGMVTSTQNGVKSIAYTPTSANVDRIRLQYYYVGGASSRIFLDSVKLTEN